MRKIDDLVIKLLEYDLRPTPQGGWEITEEMRALIHEIAEECNGLEIVKRVTEGKEEWLEQATPEEIYIHMLKKNSGSTDKDAYDLRSSRLDTAHRPKAPRKRGNLSACCWTGSRDVYRRRMEKGESC